MWYRPCRPHVGHSRRSTSSPPTRPIVPSEGMAAVYRNIRAKIACVGYRAEPAGRHVILRSCLSTDSPPAAATSMTT
jgi:hypothetical protein